MYIFSRRLPEPGIDARMPIVSGCLAVSQTLIVAHSSGDLSTVGPEAASAAGAGSRASAPTNGATDREETSLTSRMYRRVMDRIDRRSVVVGPVMELSTSEPTRERFDAL